MSEFARALRTGMLSLSVIASSIALVPFVVAPAEALTPVFSQRAPNGWAYDMVRADEAQALGVSGRGIRVAILDNGIDPRATGITGKVVGSFDALHVVNGQQEHGTATAGIVAAETLAEAGIGGIAPDAQILNVKVCVQSSCRTEGMIAGMRWAIDNGADVISMSLSGVGRDAGMAALITEATEAGIVVVAAAGNSACTATYQSATGPKPSNCTKTRISTGFPASYAIDGLISVAAVDRDKQRASYSSFNAQVDISAPGTGVATTFPWGPNADFGGTSAATPVVAGVAALVKQAAPTLSAAQIQTVLQLSASQAKFSAPDVWDSCVRNDDNTGWNCTGLSPATWPSNYYTGAGVVDAVAAVNLARELQTKLASNTLKAPVLTSLDGQLAVDWTESGLGAGPFVVRLNGEQRASVLSTSTVIQDLSNLTSYAVTVTDSSGKTSLAVLGTPGRTARASAKDITLLTPYADYIHVTSRDDLAAESQSALRLSDGTVIGCSQYTCNYGLANFSGTAQYVTVDDKGQLGEYSAPVALTTSLLAAPQNLRFEDITATTIKASWDAVPGAALYRYYDAGLGEWKKTASTSVAISGLKTALFSTFSVGAEGQQGSLISVMSPTFWYFALPAELPAVSGLKATRLSANEVTIGFNHNADAERVVFFRSDGKVQYMPIAAELVDRFSPEDVGKTFKYYVVLIDDLQYGTQYGEVSQALTVTVPQPKKTDLITTNLSTEPLAYSDEREFSGASSSGLQVGWWTNANCELVPQPGPKVRVKATNGQQDCVVMGNTQGDDVWERGYVEVRIPLVRKVETLELSGHSSILGFNSEQVIQAQVNSARPVVWSVDGPCLLIEGTGRWVKIRANSASGVCTVTAKIDGDSGYTGATNNVKSTLVRMSEKITIATKTQIWDGRTIALRYQTVSGRTPKFKVTGPCRIAKITHNQIQLTSRFTFGSCLLSIDLPQTMVETGAAATKQILLTSRKHLHQTNLYLD